MNILVASSDINKPCRLVKSDGFSLIIEFDGIFFSENTGITTKINEVTYDGHVVSVSNNRAVVKLYRGYICDSW